MKVMLSAVLTAGVLALFGPDLALAQTSVTRTSGFAYDATSGQLTQEVIEPNTSALRLQTDYAYDAFGNRTGVTVSGIDIASRSANVTFDAEGSVIRIETQYDAIGRVAQKSRPYFVTGGSPQWTAFAYDAFNRVTTETQPNTGTTTTSYNGLVVSTTNAASQVTTTTKNSQGQIVELKDTQNNITIYDYDPFGNLEQTTDALGNVTSYSCDVYG